MNRDWLTTSDNFDAAVQLCIEAFEAVQEHGTPEMRAAVLLLLAATGREVAKLIQVDERATELAPFEHDLHKADEVGGCLTRTQ